MKKKIIIISSRQLSLLDFNHPSLQDTELSLVASKSELIKVDQNILNKFTHIIEASIIKDDGLLFSYDKDELYNKIKNQNFTGKDTSIVCFDEGNLSLAVFIKQKLGIKTISEERIERFRNKVLMKESVEKFGIKVPTYTSLDAQTIYSYNRLKESLGSKFIIKPVDSAGSNNVHVIKDELSFKASYQAIQDDIESYQAETFIEGKQYQCDMAIYEGNCIFAECIQQIGNATTIKEALPYGGEFMPPFHPLRDKMISFTTDVITALGIHDGVFHTEFFVTQDEELVFLEVAARPTGLLSTKVYELATGVNLLNLLIGIQTHKTSLFTKQTYKQSVFYLVYPRKEGVVTKIHHVPEFADIYLDYQCKIKLGDKLDKCQSISDYVAYCIGAGTSTYYQDCFDKMMKFIPTKIE